MTERCCKVPPPGNTMSSTYVAVWSLISTHVARHVREAGGQRKKSIHSERDTRLSSSAVAKQVPTLKTTDERTEREQLPVAVSKQQLSRSEQHLQQRSRRLWLREDRRVAVERCHMHDAVDVDRMSDSKNLWHKVLELKTRGYIDTKKIAEQELPRQWLVKYHACSIPDIWLTVCIFCGGEIGGKGREVNLKWRRWVEEAQLMTYMYGIAQRTEHIITVRKELQERDRRHVNEWMTYKRAIDCKLRIYGVSVSCTQYIRSMHLLSSVAKCRNLACGGSDC